MKPISAKAGRALLRAQLFNCWELARAAYGDPALVVLDDRIQASTMRANASCSPYYRTTEVKGRSQP